MRKLSNFGASIFALTCTAAVSAQRGATTVTPGPPSTTTTASSSGGTRAVSPSVAATVLANGGDIELIIFWRGKPGWFFGPEHTSMGGSADTLSGVVQYGPVQLEYSFDRRSRATVIEKQRIELSPSANAILVDTVDDPAGAKVVGTASIPGRYETPATPLAPVFAQSRGVVEFLRCDVPLTVPIGDLTTSPASQRQLIGTFDRIFVCKDLH